MQWHGFKIHVVILSLIIGLAVFLGSQWLYDKLSYLDPLTCTLEELESVKSYSIKDDDDVLLVEIELDNPVNIMDEYNKVEKMIHGIVNKRAFRIQLVDNRNDILKDVYYDNQFVIYEAISRGNFREMADAIHQSVSDLGGSAKVYVDSRHIYVHMEHQGYHLYEVISRTENKVPGMQFLATGGGDSADD